VWGSEFTTKVALYMRDSVQGWIEIDVSFRTCLAGLSAICKKQSVFCFALLCCVLCELCESVLALEWCKT